MLRSPQDLYAKLLSSTYGYPLWTPKPSNEFLAADRPEGLRIGDVGVVTPDDGGFDALFNLCLPPNHRFHTRYGVPDSFTCIRPEDLEISTDFSAEPRGQVIRTPSVTQVAAAHSSTEAPQRDESGVSTYRFNLSSDEGALLILPDGAERRQLLNDGLFVKKASQNAAEWYNYAVNRRHRIISQDALYVITGLHKTCSWSVAVFENVDGNEGYPAHYKHIPDGSLTTPMYGWETTRARLLGRVGTSIDFVEPSQTVFIRGLKITLRSGLLGPRRVSVKADTPSKARPNPMKSFSTKVHSNSWVWDSLVGLMRRQKGSTSGTVVHTMQSIATAEEQAESNASGQGRYEGIHAEIQQIPDLPPVFHPSNAINQYLLRKNPSASIAITCDSIWMSILAEELLAIEDFNEDFRLERVLSENYDVVLLEGVVRLERKSSPITAPTKPKDADKQDLVVNESEIDDCRSLHGPVPSLPSHHIIFFGETGSGKSSVINLLLGASRARISDGSQPCTQASDAYETSLNNQKYYLWDTRGLGEGRSFLQFILGGTSEKDLKKFLKERHRSRQIGLLVYCVRGSRTTKASVKIYENFCAISRRLAAPVVIVVTFLEREKNMEDWWKRNASVLSRFKLDFDGYACITTLQGPRADESREKLVDLITRNYSWKPTESGSYFGSPVQISVQPTRPHHGRRSDGNHLLQSNDSSLSTAVTSTGSSVRYLANSATHQMLPAATIIPPTPRRDRKSTNDRTFHPPQRNNSGLSTTFSPTSDPIYYSVQSTTDLNDLPVPNLTSFVRRRQHFATQSGTFGDVWECDLFSNGPRQKVAVKAVKTKPEEVQNYLRKLRRELKIWWGLRHRNIVPLLGVVLDFGHLPSMVSPWFSNGSLYKYLTDHPTLHPSKRRCLLRDVAAGLDYLHKRDIIHGDLHSGNVLVDDHGIACLTDFGLSFVDDFVRKSYLNSSICGNVVFADPALVRRVHNSRDGVYPTKPCDVYSFGGLILHVLSGKTPYTEIHLNLIHMAVLREERPQIPIDIPPQDKQLIRSCWDHDEHSRPSAATLLTIFDK